MDDYLAAMTVASMAAWSAASKVETMVGMLVVTTAARSVHKKVVVMVVRMVHRMAVKLVASKVVSTVEQTADMKVVHSGQKPAENSADTMAAYLVSIPVVSKAGKSVGKLAGRMAVL
jgi:hypothetical protein